MGELLNFVYKGEIAIRLDHFLVSSLPDYSRTRLQNLIRSGLVHVGGNPVTKTGYQVESGVRVQIEIPPVKPVSIKPESIPLDIIFENERVIVVNKPAGMVVHPSAGHPSGTLVNAVLAHAPAIHGIGGEHRPGVVHRLDKDTSGVVILAKDDRAHRALQDQFRSREVEKKYLALVDGSPPTEKGVIQTHIGRDNHNRKRMAVVHEGKGRESLTHFSTQESFLVHTLLSVHPVTGRTHQIRVHLSFLGCPIVGDRLYGAKRPSIEIERQFLHARELRIQVPGEDHKQLFSAALPPSLLSILDALRKK